MPNTKDINKELFEGRVVISPHGISVLSDREKPEKHTGDIQEIITQVPTWIVRWGITLLFSTILIIAAISALVPYPEIIKSPLKLQSISNTVSVAADSGGRITKVFVEKNVAVR